MRLAAFLCDSDLTENSSRSDVVRDGDDLNLNGGDHCVCCYS